MSNKASLAALRLYNYFYIDTVAIGNKYDDDDDEVGPNSSKNSHGVTPWNVPNENGVGVVFFRRFSTNMSPAVAACGCLLSSSGVSPQAVFF